MNEILDRNPKGMTGTNLNKQLSVAVDLFVMTKFDDCFYVCADVIRAAKCEQEEKRNLEVIEAAIALGIQALAEIDKWQDVVAFIIDTYGSIEQCPPRIIQVCILLYAHVKEYLPCHKIVQAWLKNPDNLNHSQCPKVVRIYAHHILCPTGSYETLQKIVNSCTSLSDSDREALLQLPQVRRFESAKIEGNKDTSSCQHLDSLTSAEETKSRFEFSEPSNLHRNQKDRSRSGNSGTSIFTSLCKTVYLTIKNVFKVQKSMGLIIMGIFAFYAILQTQTADPVSSLGRLVILWKFFIQKLKLSLTH